MFQTLLQLFHLIKLPPARFTLFAALAEVGLQGSQLLLLGRGEGVSLGQGLFTA